jgi:hypothetical protein
VHAARPAPASDAAEASAAHGSREPLSPPAPHRRVTATAGDLVRVPLWVLVGARSGDKGGDANVGLWADDDAVAAWLLEECTVEVFKALLPEAEPFGVSRNPLPNLRAVNFVVHGILGWGVASNLRLDSQAKGLGELLRSRAVDVPHALVDAGRPAERWRAWNGAAPAPLPAEA